MTDLPASSPSPEPDGARALSEQLSARLRALRAGRGFTQDQVAQRLRCHESAVSRWESGSRVPNVVDLIGLSELYSVSVDELLGRDRQYVAAGAALVDLALLEDLGAARSVEDFDAKIEQRASQAVWLPVPDGSAVMPVAEAMQLAREVAEKFASSRYVDRLFRPRG